MLMEDHLAAVRSNMVFINDQAHVEILSVFPEDLLKDYNSDIATHWYRQFIRATLLDVFKRVLLPSLTRTASVDCRCLQD